MESSVSGAESDVGNERGQASVLALVWLTLAALLALGVARIGGAVLDGARAETAADAAALAGAGDDDRAARVVASRNGADLVEIRREGFEVQVWVRFGDAVRSSRASLQLVPADEIAGAFSGREPLRIHFGE